MGYRYSDEFKPGAGETTGTRPVPDPEAPNSAATDVRIVVRTDAAVGGQLQRLAQAVLDLPRRDDHRR
jgi:hypothetical protein